MKAVLALLLSFSSATASAAEVKLSCTTSNAGGKLELSLSEERAMVHSLEEGTTQVYQRNLRYKPRFGDKIQFVESTSTYTLKLVIDRAALAGKAALPYGQRIFARWEGNQDGYWFANYICRFRR